MRPTACATDKRLVVAVRRDFGGTMTFQSILMTSASIALAIASFPAAAAQANVVIDQASPAHKNYSSVLATILTNRSAPAPFFISLVQSFTAGTSGYLHHLDFELQRLPFSQTQGNVVLKLYSGDFVSGNAEFLFSASLRIADLDPQINVPQRITTFNVRDADFLVSPGTRYSVSFEHETEGDFGGAALTIGHLDFSSGEAVQIFNDYSGGALTIMGNIFPNGFGPTLGGDVGFSSYVDTSVSSVPEPGSWATMIGGFALAGSAMRRRAVARILTPMT